MENRIAESELETSWLAHSVSEAGPFVKQLQKYTENSLEHRVYTAVNIMIYHIMVNSKVSLEIKKIDKLAELNLGFRKLNLLRT